MGGEEIAEGGDSKGDETINKRDQIVALDLSGMKDVAELATLTGSSLSYVGKVL